MAKRNAYNNVISCDNSSVKVCVSGGQKLLFFGKFGMLCFLETPVLRFSLLPYYQRNKGSGNLKIRFMADLNKYEWVGRG